MNIVSAAQISGRAVITYIKTVNENKTRSNFQLYQAQGLEQGVINVIGRKKAKTSSTSEVKDIREVTYLNQLNKGPYDVAVK